MNIIVIYLFVKK